jgi:hypothetical protein
MNEYLPAIKKIKSDLIDTQKSVLLSEISSNDIIVVKGAYDKVESILEEMEIEHMVFKFGITPKAKLYPGQIVLVNCPGDGIDINTIRDFVRNGGWLITTDWALSRIIEPAFRGTIQQIGKTSDDVVEISPLQSQITKGVADNSQFWLEGGSHTIDILDENVKLLIRSYELKRKYNSDVIMVGFNHGKGKVFHSISHFYLQRSKAGGTRLVDAYSSLVLLTNILAQKKATTIKRRK